MIITKEDLIATYRRRPSEELIELKTRLDLTDTAAEALETVLQERGIDPERQEAMRAALGDGAGQPSPAAPRRERAFEPAGGGSYIGRHWRGDLPLGKAYWSNFLGPAILMSFALRQIAPALEEESVRLAAVVLLSAAVLKLVLWFWGARGAWVSAGRHARRGGKRGWGTAARVTIVLLFASTAVNLVAGWSGMIDLGKIVFGKESFPRATVQVSVDGKAILVSGGISAGVSDETEAALARAPAARIVVLQSGGGWVMEGERLAKLIRTRGLDTYVYDECTSACTIAFLGGRERIAVPSARLGFHQFKAAGSDSGASNASKARKIYGEAGVSPDFVEQVVRTPHATVWYPSSETLLEARVTTGTGPGADLAVMATRLQTREALIRDLKQNRMLEALSRRQPARFAELVDIGWAQLRAGSPDSAVLRATQTKLQQLVTEAMPFASDDTLLAYHRVVTDQADALLQIRPEACIAFLEPDGQGVNFAHLLPRTLVAREREVLYAVMDSERTRRPPRMPAAAVERIQERLTLRLQAALRAAGAEAEGSEDYDNCYSTVAYFKEVSALAADDRRIMVRHLYGEE